MENDRPAEILSKDESEEEPVPVSPSIPVPVRKTPSLVSEQYIRIPEKKAEPTKEIKKEEPFIVPNVAVGDSVSHKLFGVGTVAFLDKAGKYIRVRFRIGEKTFLFPDAFRLGFLRLPNNP